MTRYIPYPDYLERIEYHGNTEVERIRTRSGALVSREWLLFNSVEEAECFFNDDCGYIIQ